METDNLNHHFLVAMPSLVDTNFSKSVVYLHEYSSKEGSLGFIINKPLPMTLGSVFQQLNIPTNDIKIAKQPILMGGPVAQDLGFVIHKARFSHASTDETDNKSKFKSNSNDIVVSTSKEMLHSIANNLGPSEYLVSLGYADWEPGQLEAEITRNDWLVAPFDEKLIFSAPIEQRWYLAANLLGININNISDQVGHA